MKTPRNPYRSVKSLEGLFFVVLLLVLVGAAVSVGPHSPAQVPITGVTASTVPAVAQFDPTPPLHPTPFPTRVFPPMTPVPTASSPREKHAPYPVPQPAPTVDPAAPFHLIVSGDSIPNTAYSIKESSVIVIGTVNRVGLPRWTTANGQRPANPFVAADRAHGIFRVVQITVEQVLKGQSVPLQLYLVAYGGQIGQDVMEIHPDDLTFQEGEHVVVLLTLHRLFRQEPTVINDQPLYNIEEHYTVTSNGNAKSYYRTVTLQVLRNEIQVDLGR